jgi:hypothetical protein
MIIFGSKKRSKRTLRRIWEDNIKTDLREDLLDRTGCGYGPVAVYCKHCKEPSGYMQHEELFLEFGRYELLKKNSAL